ncbi:MAG: rhamnulokinase [Fidelibacterota bacterium]|nr:MAG: rhamnulokinase [Candidatus Neomarinimicrobiota bacterium]
MTSKPVTYLAFDLGASSVRTVLGTLEGDHLRLEDIHRFQTPIIEMGKRLYWDLDALWRGLNVGLKHAFKAMPELRSLAVDSWGVDYIPLGHDGRPVRNAYCYRDPRILGMMNKVHKRVPARDIYAITGIQFMEFNTLYQVCADLEQEPELFERTSKRLMIADYFNHRFGGSAVAEVSMASTTQLMDARKNAWSVELMDRLGISAATWPKIVPSGTRLGKVSLSGTELEIVASCSHDTSCAVAAVPAENDSRWAYVSSGTWSCMGAELLKPLITEAARLAGFTNEAGLDGTIRFLKNITGLWVLQECKREWKAAGEHLDYDTLLKEAAAAPPSGIYIDLSDQRFILRGNMQQKLQGYCQEQDLPVPRSRGEIVRVILESLAEAYRRTLRDLESVIDKRIEVLHIVGGGSLNGLLCQLTADACGCRVVAGPAEATALGNLLVQARTMKDLPGDVSIRDVVRRSCELKVYEPHLSQPIARASGPGAVKPSHPE